MIRTSLAALVALTPLPAFAVTVDDVIAEADAFCASFDNGAVTVGPDAVHAVELTGEGAPETVIDWSGIDCSTMASPWGGTGGTTLTVLIDGQRFDHMALAWEVVDFDGPVLLLSQHGVNCGATGADRCVQALVWTAGKLTGPGEASATGEAASADE
ncbi:MAG: hypothetical protein NTW20_02435 [Rhodobacterales bacterium]|nr:hypothetical protein [Rhodobacterales bacterium]